MRAVIHDRVQRTVHVVHTHAELADVDQFHPAGRQLIEGAHESPLGHLRITASWTYPDQYCARYGNHHKPLGFVAIYTMIATFRSLRTRRGRRGGPGPIRDQEPA